jgi:hypothetical protein
MKAHLVNDCSHYHVGCVVVANQLRRHMTPAGIEETNLEEAELLIINGEGTLHHDSPNVARIEAAIAAAPEAAPVVLVNALWQAQSRPLDRIDLAIAREGLSAREMVKDHLAPEVITIPDISLTFDHCPEYKGGAGLIVLDSVDPKVSRWLKTIAAENEGRFIEMCEWPQSAEALIDLLATADAVITGRFHGVVFAMLAGAPFIAAPSNTWKTRAMLDDLKLGEHFHSTFEALTAAYNSRALAIFDRAGLSEIQKAWQDAFTRIAIIKKSPARLPIVAAKGKVKEPQLQSIWLAPKTVCLVGNGPSLQGSRMGKVIDAHDEVVRFNAFKLGGFEADTGTKTTLWSTFGKGVMPEDSEPPDRIICVHEQAKTQGKAQDRNDIPRAFYDRMRDEIRAISKHPKADLVTPTSGFLVARWLLENGCPRLSLAGFDHFSKEQSRRHHYWNPKTFGQPTDHDGPAEAELLFPFVQARRIAYLT